MLCKCFGSLFIYDQAGAWEMVGPSIRQNHIRNSNGRIDGGEFLKKAKEGEKTAQHSRGEERERGGTREESEVE